MELLTLMNTVSRRMKSSTEHALDSFLYSGSVTPGIILLTALTLTHTHIHPQLLTNRPLSIVHS